MQRGRHLSAALFLAAADKFLRACFQKALIASESQISNLKREDFIALKILTF